MKREMTNCPELLDEEYGFSWMEHVLAIPSPLVNVTTYKKNGLPNATMQSWCTFVGENGYHVIFGSVNKNGHMYKSCKETACCVVNIPSRNVFLQCMKTIENNAYDNDEITMSKLSVEAAHKINAPMIKECMVNLECELEWEYDLVEDGYSAVMCFRVVNVWMDERLFDEELQGRYGDNGYLFNIHSPQNPETGMKYETYVGVMKKLATYDELK
ncbi:MAG: flavin reductase [Butyribacter sp.]|nr:flavin reductase [bacterium]MDY3854659.1 flavin reductase [Butyribacter sp.]